MKPESKTPRTDAEFHDINVRHEVAHLLAFKEAEVFARQLETELEASKMALEDLSVEREQAVGIVENLCGGVAKSQRIGFQFSQAYRRLITQIHTQGDELAASHARVATLEHEKLAAAIVRRHALDLEAKLAAIYALVEGSADGTVDATDYEKLCNRIVGITGITL